jgi:hypothetical protein
VATPDAARARMILQTVYWKAVGLGKTNASKRMELTKITPNENTEIVLHIRATSSALVFAEPGLLVGSPVKFGRCGKTMPESVISTLGVDWFANATPIQVSWSSVITHG